MRAGILRILPYLNSRLERTGETPDAQPERSASECASPNPWQWQFIPVGQDNQ